MKNQLHNLLFVLIICSLSACSPRMVNKSYDEAKMKHIYSLGVGEAAKPQPWRVTNDLIAIKKNNPDLIWKSINGEDYLLVSSWKSVTKYYVNDSTGFFNTTDFPIWVTTAPQLQQMCQDKNFGRKEGLDLRLKQILGLPPTDDKTAFVEFWVRPQDLFRPCPDSDVTDTSCGLAFPDNVTKQHKTWTNDLRIASYYNPTWNKNYPWTELGYTFDWNPRNKTNIGLSEFVIGKNKNTVVNKIQPTKDYCAVKKK